MSRPAQWPRGAHRPATVCHLAGTSPGEVVARLVARLVTVVAGQDEKGFALVAVGQDGALHVEPASSTVAQWLRLYCTEAIVGTYSPEPSAGDIEDDLCARLAEIHAPPRRLAQGVR